MGVRNERRWWRAFPVQARRRLVRGTVAVLLATCAAHGASDKAKQKDVSPAPVARIRVAPLGFLAQSPAYLQMRLAWSSLNFIDKDHLLFTFHVNELLHRAPGESRGDDDQMIRADVLEIATGKVVRTADWRMYDRARYIWALKDGKFLVRRGNELYLTDSSLQLKPYLAFRTDLQGVEVSPERTMMLLEVKKVIPTAEMAEGDGGGQAPTLLGGGGTKPIETTRTEMLLVRPGEHTVLGRAQLRASGDVPLMEDGIVGMMHGSNSKQWVAQEQTIQKRLEKVGKVESACPPQTQVLSRDVVLLLGCPANGANGNSVVALKLGGKVLWEDRWGSRYIWPTFDYAEDGSRFAYESMETNRPVGTMDSFSQEDIVDQPVGVFDTKTGKLVLVENADPILSEGQNYALSADGRRFAILRRGAIEVFDLPPVVAKK